MEQQNYRVGIYCRISREDDDNVGESGSITIQRDIIQRYCEENGLAIGCIYQDDGYSGLNFERPDFQRMIDDIGKGKINCVITKDLSRLGRDYIMTGYYTEVFFPENKVRYIAIGDGYDTADKNSSSVDFAPFKFIMNDMYVKDLSKKQRASRNAKYLKGQFLAAYAPYGYKKDANDHNKLVVDEETAPIVQMIFEKYADGMGRGILRDYLRESKIPTPLAVKHMRGEKYSEYMEIPEHRYEWNIATISTIVKNAFYLGSTVHLRYRKATHKSKMKRMPKKDQIVIEDTHEPIISQELWNAVQKRFRAPSPTEANGKNIFRGIAKCTDCGKALNYGQAPRKPKIGKNGKPKAVTKYLTCATYTSHGKARCTSHYTSLDMLTEVVRQRLNRIIGMVQINESKVRKAIQSAQSDSQSVTTVSLEKQLTKNQKRLTDIERIFAKLYEDRALDVIADRNFTMLSSKLQVEQTDLIEESESIKERLAASEKSAEDIGNFIDVIKSMEHIEQLDAKIVNALIDRIDIGEKSTDENGEIYQSIDITYKFIGKLEF